MGARNKGAAIAVVAVVAVWMLAQGASAQESYQFEVTGGYTWFESDTNPDVEFNEALVEGTYNFKPVMLKDHPWNEAAFLEHSMQAMLNLSYSEFEVGSADADGLVYGAGFRYAEEDSPIAAEVRYRTGTLDGDFGIDVDVTSLEASAGYWLQPNAIVGLVFTLDQLDPDGSFKLEQTGIAAFGKIVHKLDTERAVNGEARVGWVSVDTGTDDDDNFEITLLGDYYFTPQYSVGALVDVSVGSADTEEGTTLGARASAWFTPQVGFRVQYSKFWASDSNGDDEDTLGLFLSVRF